MVYQKVVFSIIFSDILTKGRCQLKQRLRRQMVSQALAGDRTLLIFLAKNYLGMADNPIAAETEQVLPWTDDTEEPENE